jgi:hypothetical protein
MRGTSVCAFVRIPSATVIMLFIGLEYFAIIRHFCTAVSTFSYARKQTHFSAWWTPNAYMVFFHYLLRFFPCFAVYNWFMRVFYHYPSVRGIVYYLLTLKRRCFSLAIRHCTYVDRIFYNSQNCSATPLMGLLFVGIRLFYTVIVVYVWRLYSLTVKDISYIPSAIAA